jgi:hypothetical protein
MLIALVERDRHTLLLSLAYIDVPFNPVLPPQNQLANHIRDERDKETEILRKRIMKERI